MSRSLKYIDSYDNLRSAWRGHMYVSLPYSHSLGEPSPSLESERTRQTSPEKGTRALAITSLHLVCLLMANENWVYLRYTMWCFDIHILCEMFTKIKLNNIFNTLHSHPGFCFFFLGREIKIYNAGKFQTYNKYIIIDYNHSVVRKIPRTYYPAYRSFISFGQL